MSRLSAGVRVRLRHSETERWVEGYVVRVAADDRVAIVLDDYVRLGDRVLMGVLPLVRIEAQRTWRYAGDPEAGAFEVASCS